MVKCKTKNKALGGQISLVFTTENRMPSNSSTNSSTKMNFSQINKFTNLFKSKNELDDAFGGINVCHNGYDRELLILHHISDIAPHIKGQIYIAKKQYDCHKNINEIGEIKTHLADGKNHKFMWDKQDRKPRRVETLQTTFFIFASMYKYSITPKITMIVESESGVNKIKEMLKEKQNKFTDVYINKMNNGQAGHDAVKTDFVELFSILTDNEIVILDENKNIIKISEAIELL